jgi:hypothetical protein
MEQYRDRDRNGKEMAMYVKIYKGNRKISIMAHPPCMMTASYLFGFQGHSFPQFYALL